LSKLSFNGEDHPEAAGKHLMDARVLESATRYDGAAYLTGYVVECCLKTIVLFSNRNKPTWRGSRGHDLMFLNSEVLKFAIQTAGAARYMPGTTSSHSLYDKTSGWKVSLRYRASGSISQADAASWLDEASRVYKSTIVLMRRNGDL